VRSVAALALPWAACGIQLLLWDYLTGLVWFLFYPAVFLAAYLGGVVVSLLATLEAAVLGFYCFVPPRFTWRGFDSGIQLSVFAFVLMGVAFTLFHEHLRRTARRANEALELAERSNHELARSRDEVVHLLDRTLEVDRAKAELFANLSHELRTPLTLVSLPVEILLESENTLPEQRDLLITVERNARVITQHVNNLLEAAQLASGSLRAHPTDVDVPELVAAAVATWRAQFESRRLALEVDAVPLALSVDENVVRRILDHLLSNALAYTPDDGRVRVAFHRKGDWVELEVGDSGPGIPETERASIFEGFRSGSSSRAAKGGGPGLGLSLVSELAALLPEGHVRADAAPEGGALLVATWKYIRAVNEVPAILPRSTGFAPDILHEPNRGGGLTRLLLVEDDPDLREVMGLMLGEDFEVRTAVDGVDGLEQARAWLPDVIVTDVMMPRMDGEALVTALRSESASLRDVPILVLSARADSDGQRRLLEAGASAYLVKPVRMDVLVRSAQDVIDGRLPVQA
jgi:signal transduction histidine kinase